MLPASGSSGAPYFHMIGTPPLLDHRVGDHRARGHRVAPCFQNGILTSAAARDRPRCSTVTGSPGWRPAAVSTKAMAIPRSSIGEKLPLVTCPTTPEPEVT